MTDENEDVDLDGNEFLADVAVRLVERDLLAGEAWRVAYTVGLVLDSLVDVTKDIDSGDQLNEFASNLLIDITNTLLYAHVHVIPGEKDIDSAAKEFADMFDKAEELRKNKNEPNEGE